MPRSRSRSPQPPRDDDRDRRHRSRRYDDEPERKHRSRRDEDDSRRKRDNDTGRDRGSGRGDQGSGRGSREESGRGSREKSYGREKGNKEDSRGGDGRVARRQFNPGTGANSVGPGTGANADNPEAPPVEKEKANFGNTGLLAAETNTVNGVVLKYSEPSEARKPPASQKWRLFVFKDKEIVDNIDLNMNSCWLVGRDRAVADLPVDHPSCSKQHAVLQFRHVTKVGEFGDKESSVKPYILDLDSANGTWVGRDRMPEKRYVELKEGDLVKFGLSTREYILMLEKD